MSAIEVTYIVTYCIFLQFINAEQLENNTKHRLDVGLRLKQPSLRETENISSGSIKKNLCYLWKFVPISECFFGSSASNKNYPTKKMLLTFLSQKSNNSTTFLLSKQRRYFIHGGMTCLRSYGFYSPRIILNKIRGPSK